MLTIRFKVETPAENNAYLLVPTILVDNTPKKPFVLALAWLRGILVIEMLKS